MSQTKKQKREKLLTKFQAELEILEGKRKLDQLSVSFYVRPTSRQLYVESQISALQRNLGILPLQILQKEKLDRFDYAMDGIIGNQPKFYGDNQ